MAAPFTVYGEDGATILHARPDFDETDDLYWVRMDDVVSLSPIPLHAVLLLARLGGSAAGSTLHCVRLGQEPNLTRPCENPVAPQKSQVIKMGRRDRLQID